MSSRPRGIKGHPIKMRAGRYRYRGYFIRRYPCGWKIEGEPEADYAKLQLVLDTIDLRPGFD